MSIRGKLRVDSTTHYATNPGYIQVEVKMNAVYTGIPEDNTYAQATPSASLTMVVTIPEVVEVFKPGTYFYVDFTPVDK
jgi:hypothetical protein